MRKIWIFSIWDILRQLYHSKNIKAVEKYARLHLCSFNLCISFIITNGVILYSNNIHGQNTFSHYIINPTVRIFNPKEYHAANQNWAFAQHSNGLIYIANSRGILEYDGKNWKLYELPEESSTKSIVFDPQSERLYVGATGEIGYLEKDKYGAFKYISLLNKLPEMYREFTEIWNCFLTPEGVYFYSDQQLMRWNGREFKVWQPEPGSSFYFANSANGVAYIQIMGKGICHIKKDRLELIEGGAAFVDSKIMCMEAFDDNRMLFHNSKKGLLITDGKTIVPFAEKNWDFINSSRVYHIRKLSTEYFAISTLRNGVLILDQKGEIIRIINNKSGLKDDQAISTFFDKKKNLWIALSGGIAVTQFPCPITYLDQNNGLKGGAISTISKGNFLFVGSFEGIACLNLTETSLYLKKIENFSYITYGLEILPGSDKIWAYTDNGIYELNPDLGENQKPRKIYGEHISTVYKSKIDSTRYYLGSPNGLSVAQRTPEGGFNILYRYKQILNGVIQILETPDGDIFASLLDNGIVRIKVSTLLKNNKNHSYTVTKTLADSTARIDFFTDKHGLPGLKLNIIFSHDGKILVSSKKGFLCFNEASEKFLPYPKLNRYLPDSSWGVRDILECKTGIYKGSFWVDIYRGPYESKIILLRKKGNEDFFHVEEPLGILGSDFTQLDFTLSEKGKLWIGGIEALVKFDPEIPKNYKISFRTMLRKVLDTENKPIFEGVYFKSSDIPAGIVIDYSRSHKLTFIPGIDHAEASDQTQFSYRIDGFDTEWAEWTVNPNIVYTALEGGEYLLRIKARDIYGNISEEMVIKIKILPPIYSTIWAYGIYFILTGSIVLGIMQWRVRKLNRDKIILETKVTERTRMIEDQKEKIIETNKNLSEKTSQLEYQNKLLDELARETRIQKDELEDAFKTISLKNIMMEDASEKIHLQNEELTRANREISERKSELEKANEEIHRQNKHMAVQYDELAAGREVIESTLKNLQDTQSQLILAEKMALLGNLISGVAHEINTPISAIKASAENANVSFPTLLNRLPEFFQNMDPSMIVFFTDFIEIVMKSEGIASTTEERKLKKVLTEDLQNMGIQNVENLVRLLAKLGIYQNLERFKQIFNHPRREEIIEIASGIGKIKMNMANILSAAEKTQKIIFALKNYSNQNHSQEMAPALLDHQILLALAIYQNWIKQGIEVILDFEENLPETFCYVDELDQVWINLINNSCYAMNNKGVLIIRAYTKDNPAKILVSIEDNGPGIPQEIQSNLFDAFFTTKTKGEGIGLGLHICKQIVEKHHGKIYMESKPGRTRFTVEIPILKHLPKEEI